MLSLVTVFTFMPALTLVCYPWMDKTHHKPLLPGFDKFGRFVSRIMLPAALALAVIMGYSYCKRFTWAAHLVLGLSLSIAPVGAYIALTGRFDWEPCVLALLVLTWCGGFDIIYALQDADYDRAHGLHSIPQRFSLRTALAISVALHAVSVGALLRFGSYCPQGALLWTGEALFVAILAAEHLLVTPSRQRNIGIAFGTLNGLASLTLALFVIAQLIAG